MNLNTSQKLNNLIIPFGQNGEEVRVVGMCSSRNKRDDIEFPIFIN